MLESIFEIHLIIVSVTIPVILAWVKTKTNCLDKVDRRTFRISKAMIILAEDIDKQTNQSHPDTDSTLHKRVKEILQDEKGDL